MSYVITRSNLLTKIMSEIALVQLFAVASRSDVDENGFAIRRIQKFAHPLGATLIVVGLLVLITGAC